MDAFCPHSQLAPHQSAANPLADDLYPVRSHLNAAISGRPKTIVVLVVAFLVVGLRAAALSVRRYCG
jgi:hypothetical protein